MSTGIIVNLDNVVDSVVSANVNVIAANQAVVDATAQAVIATNQASLAQAEVVAAGQQADAAAAQANIAAAQASLASNSVVEAQAKVDLIEVYKAAIEIIMANVEGLQTLTANDRALVASYMAATATYRDAADASKTLAQDALEHFQNVYLGALPQAPVNALDTNGTPIVEGALYWDTYWKALKIYNGAGWAFFNYAGALTVAGNLSDLSDFAEARANLDVMSTSEVGAAIAEAGLSLGTNYTVNDNTEKDALTDLTVSDKIFVHDDGDGKWAIYYTIAVTDGLGSTSTFKVIMDEDTYLNANTAASIKASYESNADTNVFNDADKSKLDNISITQSVDLDVVESDTALNNAHRVSDGSDHAFIDQDVTTTGTPSFNSIQLNGGTGTQGLVTWNTDEETLDVVLDGAVLQVGQEFIVNVRNNTASTIPNGTPVMLIGTVGNSGRLLVEPMDGTLQSNAMRIVGVTTVSIGAGLDGKVTILGKIRDIDTTGAGVSEVWQDNDVLYVHPTQVGKLTNVAPTSAQIDMPIAVVVHAHASGTLFVRVLPNNRNEISPAIVANYYDKSAIDVLLAAQNDANEIAITPQGNLSSDNVQSALEELQSDIDTITIITEW